MNILIGIIFISIFYIFISHIYYIPYTEGNFGLHHGDIYVKYKFPIWVWILIIIDCILCLFPIVQWFFGIINIILILPLTLYCISDNYDIYKVRYFKPNNKFLTFLNKKV